ncbi:uncharacterized protein LOC119524876 isoform X1 [Choloepus didactylus]|nr:uncharacterized protein LOC119524876 isoform X1 [Choloepus didactylus]XP_037679472.1 uncharacterized protein LOC119524876 isoform X1 [Choloepus didactylus]
MHFLWYFTGSIHSPGSGELQRGSSWARREPVKAPDRESPGGLLGGGGTEAGTKGKGACEGFFHRGGTRSDLHTELSAEEVSPGAGLVPHEVPGRPCCPRMLPEGSYFNKQASLKPTHLAPVQPPSSLQTGLVCRAPPAPPRAGHLSQPAEHVTRRQFGAQPREELASVNGLAISTGSGLHGLIGVVGKPLPLPDCGFLHQKHPTFFTGCFAFPGPEVGQIRTCRSRLDVSWRQPAGRPPRRLRSPCRECLFSPEGLEHRGHSSDDFSGHWI